LLNEVYVAVKSLMFGYSTLTMRICDRLYTKPPEAVRFVMFIIRSCCT